MDRKKKEEREGKNDQPCSEEKMKELKRGNEMRQKVRHEQLEERKGKDRNKEEGKEKERKEMLKK